MKKNLIIEEMEEKHINDVLILWKNTEGIHLHENGEDNINGIITFINRNPGLSFIVKNIKNEIVGTILCGHDGRRGYIHHLAVDKKHRKMGIAKEMINKSLERLKLLGIKKAALFVLKDNANAQLFYEYNCWKREEIVNVYSKIIL
jgi:ribosomal protein S18 acetylase RimI-like enzyme